MHLVRKLNPFKGRGAPASDLTPLEPRGRATPPPPPPTLRGGGGSRAGACSGGVKYKAAEKELQHLNVKIVSLSALHVKVGLCLGLG